MSVSERRKMGRRGAERGRECIGERKDESIALQQRSVTEQAFV